MDQERPCQPARRKLGPSFLLVIALTVLPALLAGCAHSPFNAQAFTPSYEPTNVYREEPTLPSAVRRVAVLPLTPLNEGADMAFGIESLGPTLSAELARARQFELVPVSRDELRLITGRSVWSTEDKLPLDFFEKLKDKLAVDAILFSKLTSYRAYEPLAVGWRLKLVDTDEPRVLWAVDEVFDARVPEVAAAAVRHAQGHPDAGASLQDSRSVLLSARRFGQYTASAVVQTMPGRSVAAR